MFMFLMKNSFQHILEQRSLVFSQQIEYMNTTHTREEEEEEEEEENNNRKNMGPRSRSRPRRYWHVTCNKTVSEHD